MDKITTNIDRYLIIYYAILEAILFFRSCARKLDYLLAENTVDNSISYKCSKSLILSLEIEFLSFTNVTMQ